MIKEEHAKKLICHQTFATPEVSDPYGRGTIRDSGPWTCIGSECMAWRWARSHGNAAAVGYGYCGLAGKPEA